MSRGNAHDDPRGDGVTSSPRRVGGLTLLEVLAAFLIFSMVFTVLVGTSQRGVKSQGVGARRLLANEIADREMAELEAPMVVRALPEIPEDELQDEDFTIRIGSQPLAPDASNANSSFGNASDFDSGDGGDSLAALAAQVPEVSKYLRRYDIEVEWTEGAGTQSVHRTTFAFDWQGAATDYADLFSQGGAAGLAALAGNVAGAVGDPTGTGASGARGADGPGGDRGRGAGAGSDMRLLQELCADPERRALAPELCVGI